MEKSKEYMLVHGRSPEELSKLVSEQIAEGWQPFGNPVVKGKAGETNKDFFQAMVR